MDEDHYAGEPESPETITLMAPKDAAVYLAKLAPRRTEKQWLAWLQNNRFEGRPAPYRVEYERVLGNVYYSMESVKRVARIEQARAGLARLLPDDAAWAESQKKRS